MRIHIYLGAKEYDGEVNEVMNMPMDTVTDPEVIAQAEEVRAEEDKPKVVKEGERVTRSPSTGDRVYLLDDIKKTKKWIKSPDELAALGYSFGDVIEVSDKEMQTFRPII